MKLVASVVAASLFMAPVLSVQPYLFAFGDGLSDSGNTVVQDKNIPYWNNRMSNGPVWPEYAAYFSGLKLVNYAHNGSVIDNAVISNFTGIKVGVPSLKEQISRFSATFKSITTPELLANSTASITIGSNDFKAISRLSLSNVIKVTFTVDAAIRSLISSVDTLHSLGFRNIVISTFPQPGDIPAALENNSTKGIFPSISSGVLSTGLVAKLHGLNIGYKDKDKFQSFSIIDLHKVFSLFTYKDVMSVTNIQNTTAGCYNVDKNENLVSKCSNPKNYFFLDSAYPSATVHAVFGAIITEAMGSSKGFALSPSSVKSFVSKYNLGDVYSGSSSTLNKNLVSALQKNQYNMTAAESNYQKIIKDITP
ncbi:hypothetical protein BB559_003711 [Furculomyces boomerangus]|uniref:Uncharacterized protein n=1 Tax=Furculomyces boomerangus TaxID=61424 RepID=A0A2T9YJD2_9FUNG|nr:hypothetical protein BB559_003711 [Furculomyces boomerangus]